jgi:hypothetical protein
LREIKKRSIKIIIKSEIKSKHSNNKVRHKMNKKGSLKKECTMQWRS